MDTTGVRYVTLQKTDMREMMKKCLVIAILPFFLACQMVWAGDYMNSAHGDFQNGVFRPAMGTLGYARGNCAHCHEMHAGVVGSEPFPIGGGPAPFTLFATNFNTTATPGFYLESDNMCFYCHNTNGSVQQVDNYDYSRVYGCATGGPTSILNTFNQASYHNLKDIGSFAQGKFSWFKEYSNPCNACHNPHLAKRNCSDPDNPLLSSISRPSDHFSLWGTTELMSGYSYEAPYCSGTANREPDGTAVYDGSRTPDFVEFCTDCHNTGNSIHSTSLLRYLKTINWLPGGDKHGQQSGDDGINIKDPYRSGVSYVLSCLDCHEPHGSSNLMLIRRRVNGDDLGGEISASSSNEWSFLCTRCHEADTGSATPPRWREVHHFAGDAPYPDPGSLCGQRCHRKSPDCNGTECQSINCDNCHFHGSDDTWIQTFGEAPTYKKTF